MHITNNVKPSIHKHTTPPNNPYKDHDLKIAENILNGDEKNTKRKKKTCFKH